MNILKKFAIAISLAFAANVANAADNSIYIDQSGNNATVSVTQDGAGNVVRGIQGVGSSNTTPAKIYGDGNQVSVSQIGSGNTLSLGIVTTVANGVAVGHDAGREIDRRAGGQRDVREGPEAGALELCAQGL